MSLYEQFKTSTDLETEGVVLDYGSCRIRVARAGGSNKKFSRVLENKMKPYRRQLQAGTLENDAALGVMREVFAEAIILGWETKDENGAWVSGIEGPDGEVLPVTSANVIETFNNLPDLFLDLHEQASQMALFRQDELAAAAGN